MFIVTVFSAVYKIAKSREQLQYLCVVTGDEIVLIYIVTLELEFHRLLCKCHPWLFQGSNNVMLVMLYNLSCISLMLCLSNSFVAA